MVVPHVIPPLSGIYGLIHSSLITHFSCNPVALSQHPFSF